MLFIVLTVLVKKTQLRLLILTLLLDLSIKSTISGIINK